MVELECALVATYKISEAIEFCTHRESETESQNSKLLKDLVVEAAKRLADKEPPDPVFSRLPYSPTK
ncbi:MAG: hypothetical protein HY204_09565 [Nitrospirae bacterium]|nr:hypothetical protein [Nitrospirota bacterium]